MSNPAPLATPLAWALRYAEIGWHVLPVEPRGKRPIGALVPRGMLDASVDADVIRGWWRRAPDAGIGIALSASGLAALDIDPRNGGTDTFADIQLAHGSLVSSVMAFTGGGGEHHVFSLPAGGGFSLPGVLGPGVDVKLNGYIVVEPSIHPSGKAYAWEASSNPLDGVAPSPLPDWLRSLRVDLQAPAPQPSDKPVDPRQVREVREAIYQLDAEDYDSWIRAGMALHATGWGAVAYGIWCVWAQQSDKFSAQVHRERWASFNADRANGLTIGWIFSEAQRRGWVNPSARLREAPASTYEEPPAYLDEVPDDGVEAAPKASLPFLTLADLQQRASSLKWLVKHVVPSESIGVLFGASGTFKSFVALDLALHVAHGLAWMGHKTTRAPVVFIAAEGGAGIWNRIEAWHRERGLIWQDAEVYVVPVGVDLLADSSRVFDAAKAAGVTPGLVVVDTMSQTFSGEENNATEVASYLREVGVWLRDAWLCAVLIIHHTGHLQTERPRGSSAIRNNVDFMFGCHREEKEMLATLSFHKQKDGELLADQTFAMSVFELGKDEDDDPITALVARAVLSEAERKDLVKHEAAKGRSGRHALLIELARSGQHFDELRKAYYEAVDLSDADQRRQAFYRAVKWAESAGLIEIVQSGNERRVIVPKGN